MQASLPVVVAASLALIAALGTPTARAESQMFPSKREARGLSAYVFGPMTGVGAVPEGWKHVTGSGFGASAIEDDYLVPASADKVVTTSCADLPKADYWVSVLARGKGRARIAGTEAWTDFETPQANYYAWVELGELKDTSTVAVEVQSAGNERSLAYGGVLLEGSVMPVNPVAKVAERIQAGGPATVVLLGDSVTENAGGKGGGSSAFETGNPGLMLAFLREHSGGEVDYIAHREPPSWAGINRGEHADQLPTTAHGGKTLYDARQELDTAKKIHLINLGKGGAASNWGWTRMGDEIADNDYFDSKLPKEERKLTVRYGMGHYRPDLVIVNFGTNDVNGAHPDWLVEDYLFHMKVLATMIQHRFGAAVILSTPHRWSNGVHLASHRQPQMVAALRNHARATNLALADIFNEYGPDEFDGIHPGDRGHSHIAEAYKKALLGRPSEPVTKARTSAAQLTDKGNGTVLDTETGLVWTKSAFVGGEERDAAATTTFLAEFNAAKSLGHGDWRLPTREELLKLVDPSRSDPALPEGNPFTDVAGWYRVSAPEHWGVDLGIGSPWGGPKSAPRPARIWLVTGSPAN